MSLSQTSSSRKTSRPYPSTTDGHAYGIATKLSSSQSSTSLSTAATAPLPRSESWTNVSRFPGDSSPAAAKGKGRAGSDEPELLSAGPEGMEIYLNSPDPGDAHAWGGAGSTTLGGSRRYAPPSKPLSRDQLGRIAQSFGINIPSLPGASHPHVSPATAATATSPSHARSHLPQRSLSATTPGQLRAQAGIPPVPRRSARELARDQAKERRLVPARPTPYLLTVIPPLALLPPGSAITPEDSRARQRRWKRGRLLPLQPTMGSMLLCIAREYGLPSTTGLTLYLVSPAGRGHRSNSSGSSMASFEEASGPMISQRTWATLFAVYLQQNASSRSTSPACTPVQQSGELRREVYPSPLSVSLSAENMPERQRAISGQPTPNKLRRHASRPSAEFPPTPHSLGSRPLPLSALDPVVGTIEFDVDVEQASWLVDWLSAGGSRRKMSIAPSPGGIRELRLPSISKQALSPRDERGISPASSRGQFDTEESFTLLTDDDPHGFGSTPDITLNEDDDLSGLFPPRPSELDSMRHSLVGSARKLELEPEHGALSASASYSEFTDGDTSGGSADLSRRLHEGLEQLRQDEGLLASPIDLGDALPDNERLRLLNEVDKRGSGVVMSEQLDDLERSELMATELHDLAHLTVMRSLSPGEIRLTSPRSLTPRIAAKVAAATLTLPASGHSAKPASVPRSSTLVPSPLANTFTGKNDASGPAPATSWPAVPYAKGPGSPNISEYFAAGPASSHTDNALPSASSAAEETKPSLPKATRPIQLAPALPSPPMSLTGAAPKADYVPTRTATPTRTDQPTTSAALKAGPAWRPSRPARPPSPRLEHQRTPSYSLDQSLVDQLRSPRSADESFSPGSPASPQRFDASGRPQKARAGSFAGLKGLKHSMSNKNLSIVWGKDGMPASPPAPVLPPRAETVGLFRGGVGEDRYAHAVLPSTSPMTGFAPASPRKTEFGMTGSRSLPDSVSPRAKPVPAPPLSASRIPGQALASRLFHGAFGLRKSDDTKSGSSKDHAHGSGKTATKPVIGGPVDGSFQKFPSPSLTSLSSYATSGGPPTHGSYMTTSSSFTLLTPAPEGQPLQPSYSRESGLGSPNAGSNSPRGVRRKPVPGTYGQGQGQGMEGGGGLSQAGSMPSLNSMRSFVLEDPPKGKKKELIGLGVAM